MLCRLRIFFELFFLLEATVSYIRRDCSTGTTRSSPPWAKKIGLRIFRAFFQRSVIQHVAQGSQSHIGIDIAV